MAHKAALEEKTHVFFLLEIIKKILFCRL